MTMRTLLLVAAAGCSGVQSNPEAIDAAVDTTDAAPDASVGLAAHRYVISSQVIPQTNTQATGLGLDLDGNAVVDNQMGAVLATLGGMGFDIQQPVTRDVDRGAALVLVDFSSDAAFGASPATFTLYTGANPSPAPCTNGADTVCRRHLAGTATFDVAATSAHDTPLIGQLMNGTVTTMGAGGNRLTVQTNLLTGTPITLHLIGARAKVVSPADAGIESGIIAGAITTIEMTSTVLPAWQMAFDAALSADCPGAAPTCGCAAGSQGKLMHEVFDTNQNCTITLSEITSNSLVQSLIAPDVEIQGEQALSIGIGFTAVKATFTP
ncbi:MAG: hypothetical protein ABI867_36745 [Kofleriaceae bacterium]